MKAAKEYKAQWEEVNWLRLVYLANSINRSIYKLFRYGVIVFNVLLFISYKAVKALALIIKFLLLSEPSLNRYERDETWIFRQIK